MELLPILRRDEALVLSVDQRKQRARECWEALPAVTEDTFANAPKVAMYEALRRMDVDDRPSRSVRRQLLAARVNKYLGPLPVEV